MTLTKKQYRDMQEAYRLGYSAYRTGFELEDNPYPEGSRVNHEWERGFREASEVMGDVNDYLESCCPHI